LALRVGAKPNVPMCGWLKLFLKNVRWGKNKKHWVGNECLLTRCPFVIWSVCCSLVKMVCLMFYCFNFVRLFVVSTVVVLPLAITGKGLTTVAVVRWF